MSDFRVEGYWWSESTPEYPMPVANTEPWEDQKLFLVRLARREKTAKITRFRGASECRICGCRNGSAEFSSGRWRWPSGLRHYVEDHNVEPSDEFVTFIINEASR